MPIRFFACSLLAALVALSGCDSDSGDSPSVPVAGGVAILSPADGSTLTSTPVTLAVQVSGGADPESMRVLLDGVDITARFGAADEEGVRRAVVTRPAVNLGKNQLQVTVGEERASADFWVSYTRGDAPSPNGAALPLVVPIRTRVISGSGAQATDHAIALYTDADDPTSATLIRASTPSDGSNTGFQIVYLRRSDLAVVSNTTVPNPDAAGDFDTSDLFFGLADVPPGCGEVGCLVVVQSLGTIGYTPCYQPSNQNQEQDCAIMGVLFQGMGASARVTLANGASDQIAFSFVGNTGPSGPAGSPVPPGTFFERLTCSGSNYGGGPPCDDLGFPNTSFSAPADAGPADIGQIAGVLVRDNFNNFTFAQSGRPLSFSTATRSDGLQHTITIDGVDYVSGSLGGALGGIHLLILDSTDLSVLQHSTFPGNLNAQPAVDVYEAITGYKEYRALFIVSVFGNTTYDGDYRNLWFQASQLMGDIGGTQQVFYLLNDPEKQPADRDDYTLVGFYVDQRPQGVPTGLEKLVGAERSSVISRETEAFPLGADMEGLLVVGNQGFYGPGPTGYNLSLSTVTTAEIVSASLLESTPWPFPGPSRAGSQAAYTWISQQLCCNDVRGAYVNLNISPAIWLASLRQLAYDPAKIPAASKADFDAMVDQLALEFQYVTLVRLFQRNVTALYQDQQANISLLLQQASNEVLQNLQISLSTPARSASWTSILSDVFGVLSAGSGLLSFIDPTGPGAGVGVGVQTALAVGTLIADRVAAHTNSAAGSPLKAQENEETTAGNLAGKAADEFAATLVSLGGQFDRIVTDWGRLKTVGAPLLADEVPWDANASGLLLQGYDRLVRREFYKQLLKTNSAVIYYPYMSDHSVPQNTAYDDGNDGCSWPDDLQSNPQILFYPSGAPNDDSEDPRGNSFPYDYQWAIWALVFEGQDSDSCPSNDHDAYPATFGLFEPLDPGNPDALGQYRLWFYTRAGFTERTNTDNRPCYEESC